MVSPLQRFLESRHGLRSGQSRSSRIGSRIAFAGAKDNVTTGEKARVEWIDREHGRGESDFLEILEDTGRILAPKAWADRDKKISQTEQMSRDLADRLTRNGIPGYGEGDPIQLIGAHTEFVKELPTFRQCNMIPASAQKKRNPMLNMLQYYTQTRGMKNFRHIVLHKGKRCVVHALPERYRDMKKLFNKWNKHYAAKYRAYFVFYSCEAGSPVKKASEKVKGTRPYIVDDRGRRIRQLDELGRQTWHPHIHALLEMEAYLPKQVFEAMCDDLRHCFGDLEYLYNAPLENTRELCKYMVKCDELTDITDADLVAYYHATLGLKTVQSLGGFAKFKKQLKATGRTIRTIRNHATDAVEFRPMKNWNRNRAGEVQERTEGERLEKNIRDCIDGAAGPLTKPALISRMAPSHLFSPVAEPVFMVRGRCNDVREFLGRRKVKAVVDLTHEKFFAGWQDYTAEHGITLSCWLAKPLPMAADTVGTPQDFEGFFDGLETAPQVSAHNTSTTGRNPPPIQSERSSPEENSSRALNPSGGRSPFSRPRSAENHREEPPGASGRSQNTALAGSIPSPQSEEPDWSDYF